MRRWSDVPSGDGGFPGLLVSARCRGWAVSGAGARAGEMTGDGHYTIQTIHTGCWHRAVRAPGGGSYRENTLLNIFFLEYIDNRYTYYLLYC